MTRKDYQLIANAIKHGKQMSINEQASDQFAAVSALSDVVSYLCGALLVDNERFDRAKFIKACGVEV